MLDSSTVVFVAILRVVGMINNSLNLNCIPSKNPFGLLFKLCNKRTKYTEYTCYTAVLLYCVIYDT